MTTAPRREAEVASSAESWLPLLRSLTARETSWSLWKNADNAVAGIGDVDSAAPRAAWPGIEVEFGNWAAGVGAAPVIICRHLPESLVAVACAGPDRRRLLQLDVYERLGRIVAAAALADVAEIDERGFRRLRPGAEGMFLVLTLARRAGRRPRDSSTVARAGELVSADPLGMRAAAGLLGAGRRPALAAANSVAEGGWNHPAMAALELVYAQRALSDPARRLAWLRFRLGSASRCPVLAALAAGRRIPGDVDAWLSFVAATHLVRET